MGNCLPLLIKLLEQDFDSAEMKSVLDEFMKKSGHCSKWVMYSDYCLDDDGKPNNIISFVLVPYLSTQFYQEMDETIHETQPKDIKKSKNISDEFMDYLKKQPVLSINFIVNDRKLLFGNKHEERVKSVSQLIDEIKQVVETWKVNATAESPIEYYDNIIKKLNKILKELGPTKKIKEHMDILLVTLLGAYYSSLVLKNIPDLELFGWLPDRDAIHTSCDEMAGPIFHVLQFSYLGGKQYQIVNTIPDTTIVPFYDNFNRIADVICGTLADYDLQNNVVSKDKFTEVLQGLIADNAMIRIYRLSLVQGIPHFGTIHISNEPFDNQLEDKNE